MKDLMECSPYNHNFQARHDEGMPRDIKSFTCGLFQSQADIIESLKEKIYVLDICIKCGKTIQRGASNLP